ncbi:MAG: FAD:protein FMN transferase [Oscillospiraceae bacterium]|nr:FAD:protein FMN transferase [Oscillospiraceae bacterium]
MKKFTNKILALLLAGSMAAALCACGGTADTQAHKQLFAMDTIMTLTAYGKNGDAGIDAAEATINDLAAVLDPQTKGSAVNALDSAEGRPVTVPESVTDMLAAAKTVYRRTGGALDLSVYPLSVLWGFINLDSGGKGYVPTQAEIDTALRKLCFDKIAVDGDQVTIPAGDEISFGAVAKGYTSDQTVAAMKKAGVESAIVSLGGNVQTLGLKPDGSNWNVAVEDPNDPGAYLGVLSVGQTAVITSGSYQRYFEQDGKVYHHILDPHTGYPADSGLKSVTIVCTSGVTADCLSTALFVLGKDAALNYWRTYGGFEMILVTTDDQVVCTGGLKNSFTLSDNSYTVTFVN